MSDLIKSLLPYVGLGIICLALVTYSKLVGHSGDAGLFGCIIGSGFYLISMIKKDK
mgnify:CR=1 FL=1